MGFKLASRCVCCTNPMEESVDHLLVTSELALTIWNHFVGIFHLPTTPTTINQLAEVWLLNISLSNPIGIGRNITFGSCLWKSGNKGTIIHNNEAMNTKDIVRRVTSELQLSARAHCRNEVTNGGGLVASNSDTSADTIGWTP